MLTKTSHMLWLSNNIPTKTSLQPRNLLNDWFRYECGHHRINGNRLNHTFRQSYPSFKAEILGFSGCKLIMKLCNTTSVPNYKTLLRFFFVPFYKTSLLFPTTLIIFLLTYPYLLVLFFSSIKNKQYVENIN
jgi:hypothetical protein